MFLDTRLLERKFKKSRETVDFSLPGLSREDVTNFNRIMVCKDINEISDMSNDVIEDLFCKIVSFAQFMDARNVITSNRLEDGMRKVQGLCPRRIL